jgi:hypothetical protein
MRVGELKLVGDAEVDPKHHASDKPEKPCKYVDTIHFHDTALLSKKAAAGHAEACVVRQSSKHCAFSFRPARTIS